MLESYYDMYRKGIHIFIIRLLFFFFNLSFITGCLSQEPRRVEGELFCLPYKAIGCIIETRYIGGYTIQVCVSALHGVCTTKLPNHTFLRTYPRL